MTTSTSTSSSTASTSADVILITSSQEDASIEAGGPTEVPSPASKPDEAGASACGADEVWDISQVYRTAKNLNSRPKCDGKDGKCPNVAVSQWKCGDETWEACEDCQLEEFGGWPEGTDIPSSDDEIENDQETLKDEEKENKRENADKSDDSIKQKDTDATSPTAEEHEDDDNGEIDSDSNGEETEEQWVVHSMSTREELHSKDNPAKKCQTEGCNLYSCAVWKSVSSGELWFTCLDCQYKDFGGWPEEQKFVVDVLKDKELVDIYHEKCSRSNGEISTAIAVTPPPGTLSNDSTTKTSENDSNTSNLVLKKVTPPAPKVPSASALAMHRKWQEAAEAASGSKNVRIVVSKPAAKMLIHQLLLDTFGVFNITGIYKALKCVVAPPALRVCLDEMTLDSSAIGSDIDDEEFSSKMSVKVSNSDEFTGALEIKPGRNANTTLYYLNQNKLDNGGNGLVEERKSKLIENAAAATLEKEKLEAILRNSMMETDKLLAQPTNEEADIKLDEEEIAISKLKEQVEELRENVVDAKAMKRIEKRVDHLATTWRKRRRICADFLRLMDESTDGVVSFLKCMKGEGQIEIESDDMAMKQSFIAASRKNSILMSNKFPSGNRVRKTLTPPKASQLVIEKEYLSKTDISPSFVGLKLLESGKRERVFLDSEE